MIGSKYNKWEVAAEVGKNHYGLRQFLCRCECGFEKTFTLSYLNSGKPKKCINCQKHERRRQDQEVAEEYIGKVVGDFTVLKFEGKNRHGSRTWLCRCKCGFERSFLTAAISGGGKRAASTCESCYVQDMELENRIEDHIPHRFWKRFTDNAIRRDKDLTITIEQAWELYEAQSKRCALSGLPLYFTKLRRNYSLYTSASIDRIDSMQGYHPGNVQWLDKRVNIMKYSLPQDEFLEICGLIAGKNCI